VCVHREFSHKSVGERILKIGPHLLKLLSKLRGILFLGHSNISRAIGVRRVCLAADIARKLEKLWKVKDVSTQNKVVIYKACSSGTSN